MRIFRRWGKAFYFFLIIGLCWMSGIPAQSQADQSMTFVYPAIGYPPYLIAGENDSHEGIILDVLHSITEEMGVKVTIRFLPELRAHRQVLLGQADAFPTAQEWVENPGNYSWSAPVLEVADSLIFDNVEKVNLKTLGELKGAHLGTMISYMYPSFEEYFADGRLTRSDSRSHEALLNLLVVRRVDAVILDRRTALWVIRNTQELLPEQFHFSKRRFDPVSFRLMLSPVKDWSAFNDSLDSILARMRSDGRLQEIVNRYQ